MSPGARIVVTIRNELHGPLLVMLASWVIACLVAAFFAHASWAWLMALGGVTVISGALARITRPRPGELMRLVLDLEHRTIWWAHRGADPEELPFAALRAVVIESSARGRILELLAVEQDGRWVTLGQGPAAHLAPFAREVAARVGVPLWSRQPSTPELAPVTDLVLLPEDERRIP